MLVGIFRIVTLSQLFARSRRSFDVKIARFAYEISERFLNNTLGVFRTHVSDRIIETSNYEFFARLVVACVTVSKYEA